MTPKQENKCKQIALHYGTAKQFEKAEEELKELLDVLKDPAATTEQLIDELADVRITNKALSLVVDEKAVNQRVDFKLARALNRIRASEYPNKHLQMSGTLSEEGVVHFKESLSTVWNVECNNEHWHIFNDKIVFKADEKEEAYFLCGVLNSINGG